MKSQMFESNERDNKWEKQAKLKNGGKKERKG